MVVEFEMKYAIDKLPEDYKNSIDLRIQEFEPDKLVAVEPTLPPLVYQAPNGEWEDITITDVKYNFLIERYITVN